MRKRCMKSNWFFTVSCTRDGFSFAVYVRVGDAWLESCEQFWWLRCDAHEVTFIDFSPNINWLVIFDFCINRNDLFDFIVSIKRSNTIVISEWKWISLPLFVSPPFSLFNESVERKLQMNGEENTFIYWQRTVNAGANRGISAIVSFRSSFLMCSNAQVFHFCHVMVLHKEYFVYGLAFVNSSIVYLFPFFVHGIAFVMERPSATNTCGNVIRPCALHALL